MESTDHIDHVDDEDQTIKIDIDMDKECTECGKAGATPSGLCLKCIQAELDKPKYSIELVQIDFTMEEKVELGQEVTGLLEKLKRIESQKKSATADFAAREKQAALEIDEIARKIDDGFEMRRENCIVQYDDATHMVHFILEHDESGFIIKQRKMTPSEMQRTLPGV